MNYQFNINENLNFFLAQYFYELESILNGKSEEISQIKFQSEESNTDEFIKDFIKKIILENNTLSDNNISVISLTDGNNSKELNVNEFKDFYISKVIKPNELSNEQKEQIKLRKSSIYTNPDLLLEIKGYNQVFHESVELKSTKNNKIPGSSVQQVTPYEWVIFIKRSNKTVEIATGHYINSVTEKLPFPDRSPRPQIGFNTLVSWNKKHRSLKNKRFTYSFDKEVTEKKLKMLTDWQEYLTDEWMEIVKSETMLKNEKWFNNALRKFTIKFLNYSANLNDTELTNLKEQLKELSKK